MSKRTEANRGEAKTSRCMVEVDPAVAKDLDLILKELGEPKKITLTTAALRHVVERVRAGELELVNGELRVAA
jgi:hypothetical protein